MNKTDIQSKVQEFFASYPVRALGPGSIVAMPGSSLPGVMYIESGLVEQYHIDGSGNRVVVNIFRPGAFFPMSWAINQAPNEYFYEAVEALRVRIAPPPVVIDFLQSNSEVLLDLLARVYRGTDVLLKRLALTASAPAMTRLAYELLIEAYRTEPDDRDYYHIYTTQEVLADRSGLVRETVSRQLKKMETLGHINMTEGISFRLDDLEALAGL